jgi:glycosyltransferase involved in cell wall biosynthesis
MKKEIIVVNQDAGYLTVDVVNALTESYNKVYLFSGVVPKTERRLNDEVIVVRTIKYNRKSFFTRFFTWFICAIHLFILLIYKFRKFDILYYTNPPFAYINSLFFNNRYSIVIFDLYPDALKIIGIKSNSFIFKIWKRINLVLFNKATQIITLNKEIGLTINGYVGSNKVKIVPLWSISEGFKRIDKKRNDFLIKYGWEDKFIILYSGNLGRGHRFDILLAAANRLKSIDNLLFLFIGEGSQKYKLIELAKTSGLSNVMFLPWQENEMLPMTLGSADLAVVSMDPSAVGVSLPSKIYNYIAAGKTIIGIGVENSELNEMIETKNLGFFSDGNDVVELSNFILDMYQDRIKLSEFSNNVINYSVNFTSKNAYEYKF